MGTLLQELGHDIVLLFLIDNVLKGRKRELFYIVNPAVGPRIDVHFWNTDKHEYTSAYNTDPARFVPEFAFRMNLRRQDLNRLNLQSDYLNTDWFRSLSSELGTDVREFVNNTCSRMESRVGGHLPDIVGISSSGQVSVLAEVKYEGFGDGAKDEVLQHCELAVELEVPYYLVVPRLPVYGKKLTNAWIRSSLPATVILLEFVLTDSAAIPKRNGIEFVERKRPTNEQ